MGLVLPIRIMAALLAILPKIASWASITCHCRIKPSLDGNSVLIDTRLQLFLELQNIKLTGIRGWLSNRVTDMSAQNDNVLIAQSRNVLLTGSGWGGGIRNTSHDPTGPRSADRSEKSQEGGDHPASSRRRNRANRAAYPAAARRVEARGRPGGHPRAAGKTIQPQTGREEPGESGCDSRAREVSRVRANAGQRVPWQASSDHSQSRNGEGMDDRSPAMAVLETAGGESSRVAPEAVTVRRVGAVGHQRAPVAGRARAEALPDQHDRRCHQPAPRAFCSPRLDRGKHAFAVELFRMLWASAQLLYRQGEPVSDCAQDPAGSQRTTSRRRQLASQVRHRMKVYETWGFSAKGRRGLGVSALFTGESGVGKTLAAEVLARDLLLGLF